MSMMFKKKKQLKEQGLSLVELMVVVGILGLLFAIAVPVYVNAQIEGAKSSLRTDISNTAISVGTYQANAVEGKSKLMTTEQFNSFKNQSPNNTLTYKAFTRTDDKIEYCIQGSSNALGKNITFSYNLTKKEFTEDVCKASGF